MWGSEIPIIRSPYVPDGEFFMFNHNGHLVAFFPAAKKLSRWGRLKQWLRARLGR